jgi:hypothetical protein
VDNKLKIEDWKPLNKGRLRGFAKVLLPSAWASPPARPQIGKDGEVLRESSGKTKYSPVIDFASRETRRRWSDMVIEALRASHPDALA